MIEMNRLCFDAWTASRRAILRASMLYEPRASDYNKREWITRNLNNIRFSRVIATIKRLYFVILTYIISYIYFSFSFSYFFISHKDDTLVLIN